MNQSPAWGEPPPPPMPQYQPPPQPGAPAGGALVCPKCGGAMRTYQRNGIHLEQCGGCRGIFLDFGELESLTRLESQISAPPPAQAPHAPQAPAQPTTVVYAQQPQQPYPPQGYPGQYGPGWGGHGHNKYRKQGFGRLFFSS